MLIELYTQFLLEFLSKTNTSLPITHQNLFHTARNKLSQKGAMRHSSIFLLLILTIVPQANTFSESTQLALVLKQLDGIKTSLERAQTSSSTDPQSRYFFDYLQLQQNITTVEQGIRGYQGAAARHSAAQHQLPAGEPLLLIRKSPSSRPPAGANRRPSTCWCSACLPASCCCGAPGRCWSRGRASAAIA